MSSAAQTQELDLFDALDLPPELHELQDRYWGARREWQALDAAYRLVLADMLKRRETKGRG